MKKIFIGYALFPLFTKDQFDNYGNKRLNWRIMHPSLFTIKKPANIEYKKVRVTVEIVEYKKTKKRVG